MKQKLLIAFVALFIVTSFSACSNKTKEFKETLNEKVESNQRGEKTDKKTDEKTDAKTDTNVDAETDEKTEASVEFTDKTTNKIDNSITIDNDNIELDTNIDTILMDSPPLGYYISSKVIEKDNRAIQLNMKSSKPNQITDDEQWFINNNLSMDNFQGFNSPIDNSVNMHTGINELWDDLLITNAIQDEDYIYCIYGTNYAEGYVLNIYDIESMKMVYSFDFSNYKYSLEYIEEDYDYIQQKIIWAVIKDDILYVSHGHNTYAKSSNNMNAFITAIDLSDMSILWRTEALVCNSYNFLIIDDVIISGYGFTDEPDYLYQVDINNGEILDEIPLKTGPTYIIKKDNVIFVRTYNTDYEFEIIQ